MLLLASASPARRRLLEQAQIPHQVMVSGVDEDQIQHPDPAQLVQLLAEAKSSAVKLKVEQSALYSVPNGHDLAHLINDSLQTA